MSSMNEYEEDLFELKYLEEISKLFNELKEIDNFNGLDLLKDNYCELYDFIKDNVFIYEFDDEENDSKNVLYF